MVCQKLFLNTLGYSSNNVLFDLFKHLGSVGDVNSPPDSRGRHPPSQIERISNAINPSPHQRVQPSSFTLQEKTCPPHRRYLPSELNVDIMYRDFVEGHTDFSIKYNTYRKHVRKMNISFAKLGEEECEQCLQQTSHRKREIIRYDGSKDISEIMNLLLRGHSPFKMLKNVKNMFSQIFA